MASICQVKICGVFLEASVVLALHYFLPCSSLELNWCGDLEGSGMTCPGLLLAIFCDCQLNPGCLNGLAEVETPKTCL